MSSLGPLMDVVLFDQPPKMPLRAVSGIFRELYPGVSVAAEFLAVDRFGLAAKSGRKTGRQALMIPTEIST